MSQQLLITITAKDGASQTFRTVGTSATSMSNAIKSAATGAGGSMDRIATSATKAGTSLGQAGSQATKAASEIARTEAAASKAATGLDKAGTSATKAGTALSQLSTKGAAVGAALTSVVTAFASFGKMAAESETHWARLQAAVEATGASYEDFAGQIKVASDAAMQMGFDDEDAADSIAKITTITGDATQALDLLGLSMDVARARGMDLASASQLVGRVAAGNTGILARYGIVVEEGATATEALAAMQERFSGQAEAYASTTQGSLDRLSVSFQNAGEAVGEFVNQHAGLITLLPGISAGMSLFGGAIGSVIPMLKELATGMKEVTVAEEGMAAAGGASGLVGFLGAAAPLLTALGAAALGAAPLIIAVAAAAHQAAEAQDAWNTSQAAGIQWLNQLGAEMGSTLATLDDAITSWSTNSEIVVGNTTASVHDLGDELHRLGPASAGTLQTMIDHWSQLEGTTTSDTILNHLSELGTAIYEMDHAQNENIQTAHEDAIALALMDQAAGKLTSTVTKLTAVQEVAARAAVERGLEGQAARLTAEAEAYGKLTDAQAKYAQASGAGFGAGTFSTDDIRKGAADAKAALDAIVQAQRQVADELRGQLVPALAGASHGFDAMVQPGEDVLDTLSRIAPNTNIAGGAFLQFADNLNDASQAMASALDMFSAIDNLGSQSSGAGDIASKLIGDPGTWSTIDDLVSNAAISQDTYNKAVQAGTDIQAKDVGIQEDLNAIRAQQLPLLDSAETKLAAYVDGLAHASSAEQEQALYLMDSANQAKVAAAYSTAYAASLGEIPPEVATSIIADAAQADPILGDILESFGLIEVGADGEVHVAFPDKSVLDDTTTAINNLNNSQIEMFIALSDGKVTEDELQAVQDHIVAIDGKEVTAKVAVEIDDSGLTSLDTALASGAGFGAGTSIEIPVSADTAPAESEIAAIDPAPIEVPVKIASLDTALASGAGFGASMEQEAIQVKVEADTSAIDSALAGLESDRTVTVKVDADTAPFGEALNGIETDKTVTVKVDADTSAFNESLGGVNGDSKAVTIKVDADLALFSQKIQGIDIQKTVTIAVDADMSQFNAAMAGGASGGGAAQRPSVTIEINAEDNASKTISSIRAAADEVVRGNYSVYVTANDAASDVIRNVGNVASDVVGATYNATITVTDSATQPIDSAQLTAVAFATTYTATLAANDGASSVVSSAQSAATAFATTYTATLTAVDNASGVIANVNAELDALDGRTVTTYVATEQLGTLPAKLLGGAILPGAPHAATGRVVQVGEAGPEAVVLPYGSMVQPHPASGARTAQDDGGSKKKFQLPDVDLKEAYRKGGDSATAFYDGLLDKAKSRISELRGQLNSTVYGSKEEAENALRDYQGFLNQREKLKSLKDKAQGFDREQAQATRDAEQTAAAVDQTMSDAATSVGASGVEAGAAFSDGLASGVDTGSMMEQIRALKDEFVSSMKSSAGSVGDVQSAVASFNNSVHQITDGFRGAAKGVDTQTGKMGNDLGGLTDSAKTAGTDAGDELSSGIQSGTDDATNSLGDVSSQLDDIGSAKITPQIDADSKQATEALGQTSKELGVLDGDSAQVMIHVDDSEWQKVKDDVDNANLEATVTVKKKDKSSGSGKKLGGAILADEVPHAALGRVVTVGEAGPESVTLPFGSMVTPHPASAARMRSEPRPAMNFYAPIHVHPPSQDIYGAIVAQLTSGDRR